MKPWLLQCSYITAPHAEVSAREGMLPLLLLALFFALYGTATLHLRHRSKRWPPGRTLSFAGGMTVLGFALSPPMMEYAHHSFRGHMFQHLLIGMLAPIGLVLGAPLTLALKTLPMKRARVLAGALGSRFVHILSHPVTALVLNVGGMFALYLTPLYNATFTKPYLHHLIHLHFLWAGYLFTWSMIGPDPAPSRPKLTMRLAVLFISIAAHSYLSKMMYAYLIPRNSPHTEEEIQSGAKLMYYGGDLTELLILIVLFTTWYQKRNQPHYKLAAWIE